ncbi:hypothetical protein Dimus_012200 [Dionaea muscipula]
MAIIAEKEDQIDPPSQPPKPGSKPAKSTSPAASPPSNPFTFWFYFTLAVSFLTLFFVFVTSLITPQDPKARFLSLPTSLRDHYSKGRTIKVQINPNQSPIEVFTYSQGPRASESVLIVHGLGCSSFTFREIVDLLASKGIFAVAIDLPGSGFSDKSVVEEREKFGGVLGSFIDVYDQIKEKGLFWGFDNLIEHGRVPFEENVELQVSTRKSVVPLELGSEELGRVLGQIVVSLGLAPVHLVLHDSALAMSANWVLEWAGSLRSLTLVDTMPGDSALPLWAFKFPVVREVVLGFDFAFRRLIELCCSKSMGSWDVEAHRSITKSNDGRRSIVGMGKKLNMSFDLAEWVNSDRVKGVPVQLIWSGSWSNEWIQGGRQVAEEIPGAKFFMHSSGRWPRGDGLNEIAEEILSFMASLPKTIKQAEEEPLPKHFQTMSDEGESNDHDPPAHGSYMGAYGLYQGWGS